MPDQSFDTLIDDKAQELVYQRDKIFMQAIEQKIGWNASDEEIGERCQLVLGPGGYAELWIDGELIIQTYPPQWTETIQDDDPARVKMVFKQSYRWLGD